MTGIGALLVALAAAPDEYAITAAARDALDAGTGKRPVILCEGTTNLPDRSLIDISVYFGEVNVGREMRRLGVETRGGKFSREFPIYAERNLAGPHVIRFVFDPNLQRPEVRAAMGERLRPVSSDVKLHVGTAAEAERDREKFMRRLSADIRGFLAVADEVEAEYRKARGRPFDPPAWEKLMEGWTRRVQEIEKGAVALPEYRALNLEFISDHGLEDLRNILLHLAVSCRAALRDPANLETPRIIRDSRTGLARTSQKYLEGLVPRGARDEALMGLAREARAALQEALGRTGDEGARARRRFREAILLLDTRAPGILHDAIIGIVADSVPFFDAVDAGREEARALHGKLDARLEALLRELQGNR